MLGCVVKKLDLMFNTVIYYIGNNKGYFITAKD